MRIPVKCRKHLAFLKAGTKSWHIPIVQVYGAIGHCRLVPEHRGGRFQAGLPRELCRGGWSAPAPAHTMPSVLLSPCNAVGRPRSRFLNFL